MGYTPGKRPYVAKIRPRAGRPRPWDGRKMGKNRAGKTQERYRPRPKMAQIAPMDAHFTPTQLPFYRLDRRRLLPRKVKAPIRAPNGKEK